MIWRRRKPNLTLDACHCQRPGYIIMYGGAHSIRNLRIAGKLANHQRFPPKTPNTKLVFLAETFEKTARVAVTLDAIIGFLVKWYRYDA